MADRELGRALDALEAGDWETAHAIAQDGQGPAMDWLHAHLHRVEGDAANAGYWYARAGRAPFAGSLEEERAALRHEAG
ncbi:hypothetical protein [Wenxinia saemankumensis]|uniref:Tetratricopeptide repeat-containing protein n=1 Tax=Wenxinia saemankumensis TaxID=1447782 RepID=A0A1M6HBY8_9RHOB|nr:hypothetical protein [Wenxinia saemankumensis]SHJ19720.1 hypothetical protein SAMN05444417_3147 [Wenxinia saemankumensis]